MTRMHCVFVQQVLLVFLLGIIFFTASFDVAFAAPQQSVKGFISAGISFINGTLLPVLFSIAILFFFVNITKYFIIKGGDPYSREQARKYAVYSIIAFVVIVGIWGIVSILMRALGISSFSAPCPDYNPYCHEVEIRSNLNSDIFRNIPNFQFDTPTDNCSFGTCDNNVIDPNDYMRQQQERDNEIISI